MGFYDDHIAPGLVSFACGQRLFQRERAAIVPEAEGRVLEVGFGSGHNMPFYDQSKVTHLFALEPSQPMRQRAATVVRGAPFSFEWLDLPGEDIPLDDKSVDTVLVTFTLCTIPDVHKALTNMHRVLKPGGKLVFLEHGLAPDESVRRWQNRLNGVWGKLGGGCHLNREPKRMVEDAAFRLGATSSKYLRGAPKFAGYVTAGVAQV